MRLWIPIILTFENSTGLMIHVLMEPLLKRSTKLHISSIRANRTLKTRYSLEKVR